MIEIRIHVKTNSFKCLEFIKIATKMIKKGFSIEINLLVELNY